MLDAIAPKLFEAKEPMRRLVKTFLALSMALSKGEIETDHIDGRDKVEASASPNDVRNLPTFSEIANRHQGADIYALDGAVLSLDLGKTFFISGDIAPSNLSERLEATGPI